MKNNKKTQILKVKHQIKKCGKSQVYVEKQEKVE